ncbi:alpha-tocopherol transfer protein-like [Pollicipes pollicipes]|uniref:alpha-tocopherol transfer protein-like n=1 Tax=Pollicipes pollicipes TaxID=41117 RepID=UPI0018859F29|nr:alpha-tocopherol transfer protein-like [Pollicipes pollicipes]XP_037081787.1 alpha-tocopherol transfer protein-like [Pollicipes pollicipes]XP_037081788.1 alpha-tocopherol transfer protein-like [Pollicipes pollicipes]XP_037081789.1 alpha-tocopherol transfer protein-like [Pollicipes pollicipes]
MAECAGDIIDSNQMKGCLGVIDIQLPHELKKKAEEELQEKEEWRDRDIAALRDLVSEDTELNSRLDDEFLLRFLRARKFDYDCSFQMVQQYYWTRAQNRHLFDGLRPSAYQRVFERDLQLVLPQRDHNGCRIFIFRPGAWDPSTCSMDDIFCTNVLCLEHVAREQATQVCGVVAIQDFTGFGFHHMRHFTTEHIRRMISILQGSFPLRFKGFHFVFEPKIFYWAFAAVKPFLSKKLADRLFFHGSNLKSLHAHFSRAILPRELGGSAPSYCSADLLQQLLRDEQYFVEHNRHGYGVSAAGVTDAAASSRARFYPGTFCMQTGDD